MPQATGRASDEALFAQTEDGFGSAPYPTATGAGTAVTAPSDGGAATDLDAIRREGLTGRQLRLARRMAQKYGLPATSDFDAVRLLRQAGLDPFRPNPVVEIVAEDDVASDIDVVLGLSTGEGGDDALYDQAVAIVARDRKCSTSYIQRKLGIGYNKAARLVEQMEEEGVVTRANHVGKREILVEER